MNTKADIVERLLSDAAVHRRVADDCDCRPEHTANWQHMLNNQEAAAEITKLRAERVAAARDMRERCAKVADEKAQEFRSPEYATNQPFSSMQERFACGEVAKAIRALPDTPEVVATEGEDAT